jgi:hypothetical protein
MLMVWKKSGNKQPKGALPAADEVQLVSKSRRFIEWKFDIVRL